MKSIFIIIPVVLLSVVLAGGLGQNPFGTSLGNSLFNISDLGNVPAANTLQIRNLSATQSLNPSPSPSPDCNNVAIDLLLDTSSSMGDVVDPRNPFNSRRIVKLQNALIAFFNKSTFRNDDLIGIQEFSGPANFNGASARIVIPLDTYSKNKDSLVSSIQSLIPFGLTYMKNGFEFMQSEINRVYPNYSDRKWVLVFFSDGVPETDAGLGTIKPDPNQEPTEIANTIKALPNMTIVTVGIDLNTVGNQKLVSYSKDLMKNIASGPENAYPDISSTQLDTIFNQISSATCR